MTARTCVVCRTSGATGPVCPVCGWDDSAPHARNPQAVVQARDAYRASTLRHAPDERVRTPDRLVPWMGLAVGIILFLGVMASCRLLS